MTSPHQRATLGSVAKFINGFAFKPSDWEDRGRKIIRIQNLTDPSKPYNQTSREVDERFIVRKGDILVSWSATLDVFEWREDEALLNQHIFKAVPNPKVVDKDYFKIAVRESLRDMAKHTHGSTMKHVNRGDFIGAEIPLPPLATQKHIARVLEQADQLRKQAQQMESELNQLAQSLFLEMFGDLLRNPKAWPITELGELIKQGPKNGLYKHADDYGTGSPIIRIDNFYNGELTSHSSFKRVAVNATELDKFKVDENSILINRVNSPEYLGKAALVENLQEPTVFESNMMNFSVEQDRANPLFLVTQLGTQFIREQIRKASKDAVNQSSINQGDVQSFEVALPPIAEQNAFAKRLSEIRNVRTMCIGNKSVVDDLFNSLMQRAFNGKLTEPERKAA